MSVHKGGGLVLLVAGTGFLVGGALAEQLHTIAVGGCLVLMGIWLLWSTTKIRAGQPPTSTDRVVDRALDRFGGKWLTGTPRGEPPIYKQPADDHDDERA